MHREETVGKLGKAPDRRSAASNARPAAPLAAHGAREREVTVFNLAAGVFDKLDNLRILGAHQPTDSCCVCPRTHRTSVAAFAHKQAERSDDHGFASAGLTGDCGEPRPERQGGVGDDPEVANANLFDHRATPGSPRHPVTGR